MKIIAGINEVEKKPKKQNPVSVEFIFCVGEKKNGMILEREIVGIAVVE